MNIPPITTYARKHVFESARFYYGVLVVLTSYFLLNRFLQKLSYVYLDDRWTELKIGEGVLFGLAYGFLLISAWNLRKKIPRYVFWCWGGIVLIFLINEFRFAWGNADYSLMDSLTKSQGYYTAKFTMPLLFWGVWSVLKNTNHYGGLFAHKLQVFLTANAVLIISGAVFGISLFESYPLTGRWGYSGLLWHNSINSILYGISLIFLFEKVKKEWLLITLFIVALLLLGQKAGWLYLLLIFIFVVIKNHYLRLGLFGGGVGAVVAAPLWLPYVVSFLPFWENVYHKYGVWGVVFSLRNNLIKKVLKESISNLSTYDVFIGGIIRFPERVEMMLFDVFLFYGVFGFFIIVLFCWRVVWKWLFIVPVIVAGFAGGLYEAPMGMLIYFITIHNLKLSHGSIRNFK